MKDHSYGVQLERLGVCEAMASCSRCTVQLCPNLELSWDAFPALPRCSKCFRLACPKGCFAARCDYIKVPHAMSMKLAILEATRVDEHTLSNSFAKPIQCSICEHSSVDVAILPNVFTLISGNTIDEFPNVLVTVWKPGCNASPSRIMAYQIPPLMSP